MKKLIALLVLLTILAFTCVPLAETSAMCSKYFTSLQSSSYSLFLNSTDIPSNHPLCSGTFYTTFQVINSLHTMFICVIIAFIEFSDNEPKQEPNI